MTETIATEPAHRHLGPETWARAAAILGDPRARCYEVGRPISATAPQSPFAAATDLDFHATQGVPGTVHAHNEDRLAGDLSQQGTHVDALGHFGTLPAPWDGAGDFPSERVRYFGERSQAEVKPDAAGGLAMLGVETIPPLVTTAVILDATAQANGAPLPAGATIEVEALGAMIDRAGLGGRGILAGDVVLIHTGWGGRWHDPDDGGYYRSGPGLSLAAARWIAGFQPVLVGLDNPFTDAVADGQLTGGPPPAGVDPQAPFAVHQHNLAVAGILQVQNLWLSDVARDGVTLGCFLALPLRIVGGAGSPIRPVVIGVPG